MGKLGLTELLVFFAFIIVFFVLIRELICWYFKINQRVALQQEAVQLLKKIAEQNTINSLATNSVHETSVNDPNVMKKIVSGLDKNESV